MSGIGCKDRWKPRYARIPRQFLEYQPNQRNLRITTSVKEMFSQVPHTIDAEPFKPSALGTFQIPLILFILSNYMLCGSESPARHQLRFRRWQAGLREIYRDLFRVGNQATALIGGNRLDLGISQGCVWRFSYHEINPS